MNNPEQDTVFDPKEYLLEQWKKERAEAKARDQKHFPTFYEWKLIEGVDKW